MRGFLWPLLLVLLACAMVAGIALGAVAISPVTVLNALRGEGDAMTVAIVQAIRLPRVALAALVGAGLGMSGAALQGTMRNALAEPYLLGVSGGAAVGAVIAVAFGVALGPLVPLGAFAGALLAVVLVLTVARVAGGRADPRILLMAGVVVGAFANAAILLVMANAPANVIRGALWWMMGSVAGAGWVSVRWLAIYGSVAAFLLLHWARDIDVLALGDEAASSLGVDAERASRRIYVTASLLAAATVAAAGLIGFVGLVVPNMVRGAAGGRHRSTLAASALAGATLLVVADLAARTLRTPAELPLGAVTALIGVPFFLVRLRRYA